MMFQESTVFTNDKAKLSWIIVSVLVSVVCLVTIWHVIVPERGELAVKVSQIFLGFCWLAALNGIWWACKRKTVELQVKPDGHVIVTQSAPLWKTQSEFKAADVNSIVITETRDTAGVPYYRLCVEFKDGLRVAIEEGHQLPPLKLTQEKLKASIRTA
jgi:hypothetical protein